MALGERNFSWTLADVAVSFGAAQMAVAYVLVSMMSPELFSISPGSRFWVTPMACYLLGMFIGAATMMGIYWAFSRGWLPSRWLLGGLCLCLAAFPITLIWEHHQAGAAMVVVQGVVLAFGLIFSGAAGCLSLFIRALGWTIADRPVDDNPRQYRLATFFLMVAASAILIAVGQWLFAGPDVIQVVYCAVIGVAIIASAMVLAGILLCNANTWIVASATAFFLFAVTTGIYVHGEYPLGAVSRYEMYLFDGPIALATAVTIAIPCLVLRSRGWRWRRGKNTDSPVAAANLQAHQRRP
jgi:hypothetical protein